MHLNHQVYVAFIFCLDVVLHFSFLLPRFYFMSVRFSHDKQMREKLQILWYENHSVVRGMSLLSHQYERLSSVWIILPLIFICQVSVTRSSWECVLNIYFVKAPEKIKMQHKVSKQYGRMVVDSEDTPESGKSPEVDTLLCEIISKWIEWWKKKMHSLCIIRHNMPIFLHWQRAA